MIVNPILALAKYLVKAEIPEDLIKNFVAENPNPTQEQLQELIEEHEIEDEEEINEVMYDLDKAGVYNLRTPKPAEGDWTKKATKELLEHAELDADDLEEGNDYGDDYFTLEGSEEWIIFEDEDAAKEYAKARVKDDLTDSPEIFNQNFISKHLKISDTDARLYANEDANSYYDDQDDDEITEEADRQNLTYSDAEDAKEQLKNLKVDEVKNMLKSDLIGYFEDIYGKGEDAIKAAFDAGTIDYDAAAEAAVGKDGAAYYISHYDGEEVELPSGFYAYRTN